VRTFLGAASDFAASPDDGGPSASDRAPIITLAQGLEMDLAAAIGVCTPVIASSGFPARQVNRLNCLMQKIRDTSVDDRYVNGFDYLLRTLGPRLNDEQFNAFMNQNHVRADVIQAAQSDTRTNLDLLDQRFMKGIWWLNLQYATQGAAISEAVLQIKDWVAARQQDQMSVYWCYGAGQDAYEGRFGGAAAPQRRDGRSAWG